MKLKQGDFILSSFTLDNSIYFKLTFIPYIKKYSINITYPNLLALHQLTSRMITEYKHNLKKEIRNDL